MTDSVDSQSGDSANENWRVASGPRRIHQAVDRGSVPEGAVLMEKKDIVSVMHRIINNWEPKNEMWDFNHFILHLIFIKC